ncbi:hypothetical protein HDU96_001972 [Phlyctochytrium bullatum]|nr:hypothetical protein HDU96_001972 [Phlyctochytrium bullatum]
MASNLEEQRPLLPSTSEQSRSNASVDPFAASTLVRDLPRAPPVPSSLSPLDWIALKTDELTRKQLIGFTFFATFAGTLLLAFGLMAVSTLPPRKEINYAALTNQLELLRKEWKVPGAVVGVVREGKLEYAQAFGQKNEKGEPVTLDTLFQIGSNTKAFTAMALAILVEKGKLSWSTPVKELYPGFGFVDPVADSQATLIDILSHRTGLPEDNFLSILYNTTEAVLAHVKYVKPTAQFREKFQYSNYMYTLAGTIGGQVYNEGWNELIQSRLLEPIEMYDTYTSVFKSFEDPRIALGLEEGVWLVNASSHQWVELSAPAGSIVSNIHDMAKWASFLQERGLNRHGRRLVSDASFDVMWRQWTPCLVSSIPYTRLNGYGLGFFIGTYRGKEIVFHTGTTRGFKSALVTIPDEKLSVIILSNSIIPFPAMAVKVVLDKVALSTSEPIDWSAKLHDSEAKTAEAVLAMKEQLRKLYNPSLPSTVPASAFLGHYTDGAYGELKITAGAEDNWLLFSVNNDKMTAKLKHWGGNKYGLMEAVYTNGNLVETATEDVPVALAVFETEKRNGSEVVTGVSLTSTPVTFTKVQDA